MARLRSKRVRPRRSQTERSVNYLNNVSTNPQGDNDNNFHAESHLSRESDDEPFDPQPSAKEESDGDEESNPQVESPSQPTTRTKQSKHVEVVIRNSDLAGSDSGGKSSSRNQVNGDDTPDQDEEIPESGQQSISSEDSEDASEYEDTSEQSSEESNVEQTTSRRRKNSTEREEPVEAGNASQRAPVTRQRTRIVDRMARSSPQTNDSSSRKRRRATDIVENEPQSSRRRRQSPIRAGQPEEFAEWEASMVVETAPTGGEEEEEVVIHDDTTYDDATKIMGLERSWGDLMNGCQKIQAIQPDETIKFRGVKDICDRIQALNDLYKQIQRDRSTESITPRAWQHTERSLKPISDDADLMQLKIMKRANEGRQSNDFRIKADASEYAEQIYKHVVTNLSELALECLKAYYSEETKWLLSGGFTAIMNILDITGKINNTLSVLKKRGLISMTRDISRHLRIPLRIIYDRLSRCEVQERQRER